MRRQMVTTMYNKINYQRAHSHLNCHVTPPLEHNKGTDFVGVNRTLAAFTMIVLDVLCIAPNKESRLGQGVGLDWGSWKEIYQPFIRQINHCLLRSI